MYQEPPGNYGISITKGFPKGFLYEQLKGQVDWALFSKSIVTNMDSGANLLVEKLKGQLKDAKDVLLKAKGNDDVVDAMKVEQLKNTISRLSLTLQTLQVVVEEKAPLDSMDSALKERDFTQEVEECTSADGFCEDHAEGEHFTEVEFVGGNKCEEQNSKVLVHEEKEDVLDKEAEPDAEVEIVGGYSCEEQDPKDNEVSTGDTSPLILQAIQMMQREIKRKMTDGSAKKPREDAEGQTKTSKDQLKKDTGENSKMESGRKDAATSNIDNLDHIISMIVKSTVKDPLDVDTSFKVEGQVPCASNIEDQEDKNTEFVVIVVDAGGDASCAGGAVGAGDDTKIIIDKYKPPWEDGDASVDAGVAVGAGEDTDIIIEKLESPQEDGDASVDVGGEASYGDGAVGATDDTKMIIENSKPPQGDGDAFVDAGGDGSCAAGAVGAEYVRPDDGTVSWQREDGDGASGATGYVRNNDGTVSCPWEDPGNILFESKPALILDINGVLLTSVDKRYRSQMPAY
ncbi:hypothetical protein L7F22_013927 [Adiantum nelumboides]|nr:hypothetical protein [Adiantum nelumboides]